MISLWKLNQTLLFLKLILTSIQKMKIVVFSFKTVKDTLIIEIEKNLIQKLQKAVEVTKKKVLKKKIILKCLCIFKWNIAQEKI